MKNLFKLNVFILIFSIFSVSPGFAADRILPVPKPSVDQETKTITSKKKEIYPQKKPREKSAEVTTATETFAESEKIEIIYPLKKPIIFHKKIDKAVVKSTILSSADLKIAKSAFESVKKRKWQTALKISKKAKKKMVFKTVNWLYLIKTNNAATFYDYLTFINNNPFCYPFHYAPYVSFGPPTLSKGVL